jgi:hypothetical protein
VAVWLAVLVLGVLLYTATVFGTIRSYGGGRVPRLGFWPEDAPWWAWAVLAAGIAVMIVASTQLAGPAMGDFGYLLLLLPCVLVSWAAQMAIIRTHNWRLDRSRQAPAPRD